MYDPRKRPSLSPWLALLLIPAIFAVGCDDPVHPASLSAQVDANRAAKAATYRVTVHNTTEALQPLTPSVVALHNPAADVFEVGEPASAQLERIAESGMNGPLVSLLEGTNQVFDVGVAFGTVEGEPGPILPGASASVEIQGPPGLRLSLVSMLVCTNDGFTGLDAVRLPKRVGESVTHRSAGYDAGTEQNTEAAGDLVPPCVMATTGSEGGTGDDQPAIAEDEVIRHHPGIDESQVDGDILVPETHQWSDPAATIEIERID